MAQGELNEITLLSTLQPRENHTFGLINVSSGRVDLEQALEPSYLYCNRCSSTFLSNLLLNISPVIGGQ